MFWGKVIGTIVASRKSEKLIGYKLLVIQKVNHHQQPEGEPIVAVDYVQAGIGDFVFLAKSKDAAIVLDDPITPIDAGIVGIVDCITEKT